MKLTRMTAGLGGAALVGAAVRRHQHDLDTRRTKAQDRQAMWYRHDVFHVVTFLRCSSEADAVESVRDLYRATRTFRDVQWIYAGKAVATTAVSKQIGHVTWDAAIVLQYASRQDYQIVSRSLAYKRALEPFAETYSHGFTRSRSANAAAPVVLGCRRAVQRLRREPAILPFEPNAARENDDLGLRGSLDQLLTERELGAEGAVAINLIARGSREQRTTTRRFTKRMQSLMAEGGFGPTHLGRSVTIEGDHHFDAVAVLYYPGVQFLVDLAGSSFHRETWPDRSTEDLMSLITVPILYRL